MFLFLSPFSPYLYIPWSVPDSSPEGVTIHEALLQMINDTDHAVRMHMAKVVTFLHCVAGGGDVLVSREEQLQIFQKVSDMLKKANLISVS